MNTKAKKIFLSILISIVGTAAVALGLCYFVFIPDQTKEWLSIAWQWLNEPLPVVGVSSLVIAFFIWKIFISSSFGKKKYNEVKNDISNLLDWLSKSEEEKEELKNEIKALEQKNKILIAYINQIKNAIPNKKVKQIAEIKEDEEERKETINN